VRTDKTRLLRAAGYAATWKESIEAVEGRYANDADFSRVMREQVNRLRRDYYQGDGGEEHASFETIDYAGSLEVTQDLTAASPDILSVSMRALFYEARHVTPPTAWARAP
jgi:hypothetical protein